MGEVKAEVETEAKAAKELPQLHSRQAGGAEPEGDGAGFSVSRLTVPKTLLFRGVTTKGKGGGVINAITYDAELTFHPALGKIVGRIVCFKGKRRDWADTWEADGSYWKPDTGAF